VEYNIESLSKVIMTQQENELSPLETYLRKNNHTSIQFLKDSIQKNLGVSTLQKIESRVMEIYHIPLDEAILDFDKFDFVLREFFGSGAKGLEYRIFLDLNSKN
jgi:hypothetical protein